LHVTPSLLIKDAFLSYSLLTAVVLEQNDSWHVVDKQVHDLNCKLGTSVTVLFLEEETLMRYDLVVWSAGHTAVPSSSAGSAWWRGLETFERDCLKQWCLVPV
jgi:hypothetical protein